MIFDIAHQIIGKHPLPSTVTLPGFFPCLLIIFVLMSVHAGMSSNIRELGFMS